MYDYGDGEVTRPDLNLFMNEIRRPIDDDRTPAAICLTCGRPVRECRCKVPRPALPKDDETPRTF